MEIRKPVKIKQLRPIILTFISLAMISVFVWYLYTNADQYMKLLDVSIPGLAILFLLSLALPVLNGMQNTILYRNLGITDFTHWDGFLLSAISGLANQLPIPGGVISKGYYLKRRHNLSYTIFSSSSLALFLCYVSLNGFIGLSILLYWLLFQGVMVSPILWVVFGLMMVSILMFWLPLDRIKLPDRIQGRAQQALDGWLIMSRKPSIIVGEMVLQLVMIIFLTIRYWLALRMLSQDVPISFVLLMSNVTILTQTVSLAPGGLGVREALVGGVASALGFDIGITIVAVGLDRLVATFVKLLVGSISTIIVGNQMTQVPVADGQEDV